MEEEVDDDSVRAVGKAASGDSNARGPRRGMWLGLLVLLGLTAFPHVLDWSEADRVLNMDNPPAQVGEVQTFAGPASDLEPGEAVFILIEGPSGTKVNGPCLVGGGRWTCRDVPVGGKGDVGVDFEVSAFSVGPESITDFVTNGVKAKANRQAHSPTYSVHRKG